MGTLSILITFSEQTLIEDTETQLQMAIEVIDLRGVAEVRINNFDYRSFDNKQQILSINSKRAVVSYKQQGIILKGHVIVTSADGSRLESNLVKWDTSKDLFKVDGAFVMSMGREKVFGRDTCFDRNLKIVGNKHVNLNQMEAKQCYTKL